MDRFTSLTTKQKLLLGIGIALILTAISLLIYYIIHKKKKNASITEEVIDKSSKTVGPIPNGASPKEQNIKKMEQELSGEIGTKLEENKPIFNPENKINDAPPNNIIIDPPSISPPPISPPPISPPPISPPPISSPNSNNSVIITEIDKRLIQDLTPYEKSLITDYAVIESIKQVSGLYPNISIDKMKFMAYQIAEHRLLVRSNYSLEQFPIEKLKEMIRNETIPMLITDIKNMLPPDNPPNVPPYTTPIEPPPIEPPSTPPPPIVSPTPTITPICIIDCGSQLLKAKNFYDTKGEWAGKYTMTPIKYNKVDDTTCDILYTYNGVNNTMYSGMMGQDKRRFGFTRDDNCNWSLVSMGAYQSGTTL